ncbi:MAG: 2-oxoglutarate and iron-dependent oxygenase domain-containing protein [Propionibacteriaceae bacterium]|nr:2-oxoglutarate and iron-dependent oxygenase domain-containing protein [Propionibacteriaceae bacterium]
MTRKVPVLDLRKADQGPHAAAEFRRRLREATHEIGVFHLAGHGIPDQVMTELFVTARRFFALPPESKRALAMVNSPHFRGYTADGGEYTQGARDRREQIDLASERPAVTHRDPRAYLRLEGPNQWPTDLPELRPVIEDWDRRLTVLGHRLLREWAVSLGAAPELFTPAFGTDPMTLIKLVRYPGRAPGESDQGVGAHKDPGVLTLLLIEPGKRGLEVELDGAWIAVEPVAGAFVVNIGELMEWATGGYLRATLHRVVSPPQGEERLSVPYFLNPRLDSQIPRVTLSPELAARARGVTQDPANVISDVFGANMLKARLRAHPDVAARHHPDLLPG